jgi:hypothetical protein
MIHNGIEYGMMQALAEGFALLAARPELDIDAARLAQTWRHGSVVRSWLLDAVRSILEENEELAGVAPVIDDSGSGRWTALESIELGIPAPVITTALMRALRQPGPLRPREQADRDAAAALRGARDPQEPMIVLVMGVSGSGKNTVGEPLAQRSAGSSSTATTTTRREREEDGRRHCAAGRGPLAVARPPERHPAAGEERGRRLLGPQGSVSPAAPRRPLPVHDCPSARQLRADPSSRVAARKHRYMPASLLQSQFETLEAAATRASRCRRDASRVKPAIARRSAARR